MTDHASDLDRYLRILVGADPAGRLIEIRSAHPERWHAPDLHTRHPA